MEDCRSLSSKICWLSGFSSMLYLFARCITFYPNLAWLARPTLLRVYEFGSCACTLASLVSLLFVAWP